MHYAQLMSSAKCTLNPIILPTMDSMGDRLRHAREAAGLSIAEAVERLGAKYYTYVQHENGHRTFPAKRAEQYAKLYRISVEWLQFGRGPMKPGAIDHNSAIINWDDNSGIDQPFTLTVIFLGQINKKQRLSPGGDVMEESRDVEAGKLPRDIKVLQIEVDAEFTGPGLPGGFIFIADFDDMPPLNGDKVVLRVTQGGEYRYIAATLEVTPDGDNRYWTYDTGKSQIQLAEDESDWIVGKIIEYRLRPGPNEGRAARRQSSRKSVDAA